MSTQPQVKYRKDYTAPAFTITEIDLDFQLDENKTIVTATSQVQRCDEQATTLQLVGENLTLLALTINDTPWQDYEVVAGELHIHHVPATFTLQIVNQICPKENTALEGLYLSGGALCTQCEAEGFRHITYYLDRPDVLARFTTKLTADKTRYPYLLSNGNRIASGELDNGQHWVQWQDPFPKPSYLFALVAGKFEVLKETYTTQSGRDVALELYVDLGQLDRAGWAMTSLKNAMKWDEHRFNLEYDLDIYMIVAVDFFNMGAMENKGLNIFNSKFVLAKAETATDQDYLNIESVIGHEYFHNWTGNRVTCRDWFQLSLKEGLTVFRDQEFSSDLGSRSVNRIDNVRILRSAQFTEDASPMAHPIRPEKVMEMNNFYTVTVYEKGAEVIRMMHTLLGEAKFQAGMARYIQQHDGRAATCDDFVHAMEAASGIDLTQFRRWYSQSGTPVLTVSDEYDATNQRYILAVKQHTPPTADQPEKLPLHIPLDIELYAPEGKVIPLQSQGKAVHHVLNVTEADNQFIFEQVPVKPVISLLREFSAPVKLHYDYTDEDLIFLTRWATDDFARYDAAYRLLVKYIKQAVASGSTQQASPLPEAVVDAFRAILLSDTLDPAFIARIMTLPSESELAEQFEVIDPDAISQVCRAIMRQFALEMNDELMAVYQANKLTSYRIQQKDIAQRALKNRCLAYLVFHPEAYRTMDSLVAKQYYKANNMTDTLAALSSAVAAQLPCQSVLMADFEQRWHQDGLVMDKWFMLQATSPAVDVLDNVKALLTHRAFSLSNPNRVRALIGAFVANNPVAFHAVDGRGYAFLTDMLITLNQRNPQVASRLIEPLIRYQRYDKQRQALMHRELTRLQSLDNLSKDLYEKISKALS